MKHCTLLIKHIGCCEAHDGEQVPVGPVHPFHQVFCLPAKLQGRGKFARQSADETEVDEHKDLRIWRFFLSIISESLQRCPACLLQFARAGVNDAEVVEEPRQLPCRMRRQGGCCPFQPLRLVGAHPPVLVNVDQAVDMVEDAPVDGGKRGSRPFAVIFQDVEPLAPRRRISAL
ncbi:hypothetical protein D3C71_1359370 [compost metagenome]